MKWASQTNCYCFKYVLHIYAPMTSSSANVASIYKAPLLYLLFFVRTTLLLDTHIQTILSILYKSLFFFPPSFGMYDFFVLQESPRYIKYRAGFSTCLEGGRLKQIIFEWLTLHLPRWNGSAEMSSTRSTNEQDPVCKFTGCKAGYTLDMQGRIYSR